MQQMLTNCVKLCKNCVKISHIISNCAQLCQIINLILFLITENYINPYFCRPYPIILSRLRKNKEKVDKSKIFLYSVGFVYHSDVVTFS